MSKIKNILHAGLSKLAEQHTIETLGDRKTYLGASDIAHCPRKVVLQKIHGQEHDFATLVRFERGHTAEDILARAFTAAGYTNFEQQVEVVPDCGGTPVKIHIDFVFTAEKQKIKYVLEVKSPGSIPQYPYGNWESQLYIQMGALQKQYPDYAIKGIILAFELGNDGNLERFDGYTPVESIYNSLIDRAKNIWNAYQAQDVENLETEISPLCGFCDHIATCPAFEAAEEVPELDGTVLNLLEKQSEEKKLDGEIKTIKKKILKIVEAKGTIKAGGRLMRKATRNRKHLLTDELGIFLAEQGSTIEEFQENRPFSFLEIKKMKA